MAAIIKIVHSLDFAAVAQEIVNCDHPGPPRPAHWIKHPVVFAPSPRE